ncbi:8-oxoguanine glycosylase ogg1 [Coemansia helicoidea]|uniref:8-oxoguanine glycosylase ogg1 n=1 Tax=Coemansia helicoidea TaxID=1286919 RepID=A0ACC1LC01_9FUNG|nr:8-oxoguanine glycosylase ogg1 [Coemansia helicoidea]
MLVDRLCERYGESVATAKGRFYAVPSVAAIAKDPEIEATFRGLGFGYRAAYYAKSVQMLCAEHPDPDAFLDGLRALPAARARAELLRLSGVGPKVADCVCLMSLDNPATVPIDTHMWQVAQRRYVPRILDGSLPDVPSAAVALARQLRSARAPTSATYEAAQQLFVHLFGPYSGWAQGLLFSGDLAPMQKSKQPASPDPTQSPPKRRRRQANKT